VDFVDTSFENASPLDRKRERRAGQKRPRLDEIVQ
jgi:hypothetical protein